MPGIDLAALSGADLRRLLKVAHTRHDGLLSDRLEWEIADRAAHGNRAPTHFAAPPEDDEDEPTFRMAQDVTPYEPDAVVEAPSAPKPRGVVLVTLGALAGALLSAAVFWGLERIGEPPSVEQPRSDPQMVVATAAPPVPEPTFHPVVATDAPTIVEPVRKPHRPAIAKRRATENLKVARAEQTSRSPNLSEWLSSKPEEPIY